MAFLLRTTALLVCLDVTPALFAQNEVVPAEPPSVAALESEGQSIFSVPSLRQLWEAQAVLNVDRDKVAFFSNDEDVVFVQSSNGTVTAFNAESGREFWSAQVGQADEVGLRATTDSQTVVIIAGPSIYGFEKFTGRRLFGYRLPDQPTAGPVLANGSVVVPVGHGSVSSFTLSTLIYLGRLNALPSGVPKALDWQYTSGELTTFPPVAGQQRVVFSTEAGNIHAVNIAGSQKGFAQFQFLMQSRATAPLTLATRDDKEFLLSMSEDNRLFCIELQTNGKMRWTIALSRPVTQPVIAIGQEVFVLSEDGELAKFSLITGQPAEVSTGIVANVSETEDSTGKVPAFGAVVDVRAEGFLEFSPFTVSNLSTGQNVKSVVVDLSNPSLNLAFAANAKNEPTIRVLGNSGELTGVKSFTLSDDRKILTLTFGDFEPNESLQFHADIEHTETPAWKVSDMHLIGARVLAYVSAMPAAGRSRLGAVSESVPPQKITGRFAAAHRPWIVQGVKSIASISQQGVYLVDREDRLVAVNRKIGLPVSSMAISDYSICLNNNLTDRVYLSTSFGRVACFSEKRTELGVLPVPTPGGVSWLLFPKAELAADFAMFHQKPGGRPIMPNIPKSDPIVPADDAAGVAP